MKTQIQQKNFMDENQNLKKLYHLLSSILDIPEMKISDGLNPENTPSWDSFNNLTIVSKLQDTFKINLSLEEIRNINSVKDIKKILSKYGVVFLSNF